MNIVIFTIVEFQPESPLKMVLDNETETSASSLIHSGHIQTYDSDTA